MFNEIYILLLCFLSKVKGVKDYALAHKNRLYHGRG